MRFTAIQNTRRPKRKSTRGFTLLEVLVATLIMGIAISGVLGGLAGASRNAARLTEYDRATLLAQQKMDELLADHTAPRNQRLQGNFDPNVAGMPAAWTATVTPFEAAPGTGPGAWATDRVELEILWMSGETRKSFSLEGFRRGILQKGDRQF